MEGRCKFCYEELDEIETCGICEIHLCIVCGSEEEIITDDCVIIDGFICPLCKEIICSSCGGKISKKESSECVACSNKLCMDCKTTIQYCKDCEDEYCGQRWW